MIWFRKFAALLLLSLGAALMFLPFPASLAGERAEEVVRLSVQPAPFTEESARAQFGDSFIEFSYEGMDEFPEVREAILGVMGQISSSRCVPSGEWHALLVDRSVVDPEGVVYAFQDGLYRIVSAEAKDFGPEGVLVCFETTMLGAYDNHDWSPMARLDAGDLDRYPELKAELERLAAGVPHRSGRASRAGTAKAQRLRRVDATLQARARGWCVAGGGGGRGSFQRDGIRRPAARALLGNARRR